jgi:hypothetical protein
MGEARIARMMSRIELSSPPGVSICSMTMRLPLARAVSSALMTYREVAGPIAPLISSTVAVATPTFDFESEEAATGGAAADTEFGMQATNTVMTNPARTASVTPRRSRGRAKQAFTSLTLLPSEAGCSKCSDFATFEANQTVRVEACEDLSTAHEPPAR